ncbi:hypothetical protein HK100_009587 [Physocladia obscura]|uniref:Uncharacterized protein n=1 Tax=Physocladia obscura TaxID=109957 RepID=A0AAD5T3X7_9FUNG|nr:hypothetical protein HK100_009587 [Physocladia obscura]
MSASEGILFSSGIADDEYDEESIIRFTPLDDATFEELKAKMIASVNVDKVDKEIDAKNAASRNSELLSGIKNVTGNISRMLNFSE